MPDNDTNQKKIYDKFNNDVQLMIIFAKAASINTNIDCIYPESLIVGLLTIGVNNVSSSLIRNNVDLEKCLKFFKTKLMSKKNGKNADSIGYESLKISRGVIDTCKMADQISVESKIEWIGIEHIFVALIRLFPEIKKFFTDASLNVDEFCEEIKKQKPKITPPPAPPTPKKTKKQTKPK